MDLNKTFEKFSKEYLQFKNVTVTNKLHPRPDVCAFLLLDKLCPGEEDMVSSAEHDEIWLNVDCEKLAEVATEDGILMLVRCGVRYDEETGSLAMFV